MVCPKCGTENDDRNVCLKCGEFLSNKRTIRQTDPVELRKERRRKVKDFFKSFLLSFGIILAAFIVLSVIMFIVFYFVFDNMDFSLPDPSDLGFTDPAEETDAETEENGTDAETDPAVHTGSGERSLIVELDLSQI